MHHNQSRKPRVHLLTLGCAKNLVDSEYLLGKLYKAGLDAVHESGNSKADIAIVNTCGFIGDAKEESIEAILHLLEGKKKGRYKKVIVMGCLSQRYREELAKELPGIDGIFGVDEQAEIIRSLGINYKKELAGERMLSTPSHYAYLKISEGCDRLCSFCAIPGIRGKQLSIPADAVIQEAAGLAARGVRELNIIAQDTSRYGVDLSGRSLLANLLERLSAVAGIEWIRLHYAYPLGFPEAVLDLMQEKPNICRYLDLPLQHINPAILKSMKRGISRKATRQLIDHIRGKVPGIGLRTTFMVGYPGEGEKEFRDLYDFVESARFDRLGVFTYSPEEGTPAFRLGDPVPQKVKEERRDAIMELQMGISAEINAAKVGKTLRVVIDRKEGSNYIGRTEHDSPEVDNEVIIDSAGHVLQVGDFCEVMVTSSGPYDLYAKVPSGN